MSLFAIVVSGRLVQTDFQQVDTNKFLITIPNADSINHIVVFMTGTQPLPEEMGASVHFSWPNENAPPVWKFLGVLTNNKPSSIFKITNFKVNPTECSGFYSTQQFSPHFAQIGISIEPLVTLNLQQPEILKNNNQVVPFQEKKMDLQTMSLFVTKTAENLFNHVSSFCTTIPNTNQQMVPISSIESWYNNYKRKLEIKPDFWLN